MTKAKATEIATQIARNLFLNGMGELAHRLVLTAGDGRYLGGLSEPVVRDRIVHGITAALNANQGRKKR